MANNVKTSKFTIGGPNSAKNAIFFYVEKDTEVQVRVGKTIKGLRSLTQGESQGWVTVPPAPSEETPVIIPIPVLTITEGVESIGFTTTYPTGYTGVTDYSVIIQYSINDTTNEEILGTYTEEELAQLALDSEWLAGIESSKNTTVTELHFKAAFTKNSDVGEYSTSELYTIPQLEDAQIESVTFVEAGTEADGTAGMSKYKVTLVDNTANTALEPYEITLEIVTEVNGPIPS